MNKKTLSDLGVGDFVACLGRDGSATSIRPILRLTKTQIVTGRKLPSGVVEIRYRRKDGCALGSDNQYNRDCIVPATQAHYDEIRRKKLENRVYRALGKSPYKYLPRMSNEDLEALDNILKKYEGM